METADKVSVNLLLADILSFVDDESTRKHGFNRGYYISAIQKGVEKLAYDTFFDVVTKDILLLEENKRNLAVEMPPNAFNIREMYLFNCTCKDSDTNEDSPHGCCSPANSVIVHWKRLYNNRGKGPDYTALRQDRGRDISDPIYPSDGTQSFLTSFNSSTPGSLFYANVQNGLIMLSLGARNFTHLRLVFNGTGGAIGDEPVIPRFLRGAIVDFVVERTLRALKVKDRAKWRVLWVDAKNDLRDPDGDWMEAERRIRKLGTWKKNEIREWTGRPNI